jgi:low affinity Fe/Cu permease
VEPIESLHPSKQARNMNRFFGHLLTRVGVLTAHPAAFGVGLCYLLLWLILDLPSFDWHSGATVATFFMALFIQRAEHRDTQAIHAKLDELLRVEGDARNELTGIDQQEPESIEKHRSRERKSDR